MKKPLKIAGIVLLGVIGLIVLLVLALPLWIGPVAKGVSHSVVPGITGTDFHMGEFGLNIYNGHLHVGDVQLANPTNFSEKNAVDLGKLDVDVEMSTLLSKKMRIASVDLDGLTVYCSPSAGNFTQIAENASGGAAEEAKAEEPAAEGQQGGGVQIDRITLKNITIKYGIVPVKIPVTIELTDIGKDKEEGASWTDVWAEMYGSVMKAAGAVTGAIGDLGKAGAGLAADAAGAAAGAAADAAGAAAGAVGDAAGAAAGAVGDAAGKAVDAIGGLFKK